MNASRKVLLVEDDRETREIIAELLMLLGHQCRAAGTAASALEALADYAPQVVLLDLGLPDMSGHDLARRVRARCGQPTLIAAVTGRVRPSDIRRSFESGIDLHLAKPIGCHALRRVLSANLDVAVPA